MNPVCGGRIRQARLICHLTRENLATMAGISLDGLYRCESGIGAISEGSVSRISSVTGFTPEFFAQPNPPKFAADATYFHDEISLSDAGEVKPDPRFEGRVLSIAGKRRTKKA